MQSLILVPSFSSIFRKKVPTLEIENIPGIWLVNLRFGNVTIYSTFYTRIDQACLLWGIISLVIFITAQFFPLNWKQQAIMWSVISLIGTVGMVKLTRWWVRAEKLDWILDAWVILMVGGVILTDLSIFLGWGKMLIHLSDLWLGLVAIGYFFTAAGMRSRTFTLTGLLHLLGILLLPYFSGWQFLTTGIIMGGSVILLAELEWDSEGTCSAYKQYIQLNLESQTFESGTVQSKPNFAIASIIREVNRL